MMLRQHATATFAIVFPFLFQGPGWIPALLFAVFGSLLPDMDISDCNPVSGNKDAVSRVLSFLGLVFNWPVSRAFSLVSGKDVTGHRGFAHTVIAGALLSALAGALLFIAKLNYAYAAWLFAGYLLHLLEDAMTPSGVEPFFPFGKRIYGRIRTDSPAWGIITIMLCMPSALMIFDAIGREIACVLVAAPIVALMLFSRIR
jgi:membrane-bound metal-dependent hydrolase YbcI (DUF457 family)